MWCWRHWPDPEWLLRCVFSKAASHFWLYSTRAHLSKLGWGSRKASQPLRALPGGIPEGQNRSSPTTPDESTGPTLLPLCSLLVFLLKPGAESGSHGLTSAKFFIRCGLYLKEAEKWASSYPDFFCLVSFAGRVPCVTARWAPK